MTTDPAPRQHDQPYPEPSGQVSDGSLALPEQGETRLATPPLWRAVSLVMGALTTLVSVGLVVLGVLLAVDVSVLVGVLVGLLFLGFATLGVLLMTRWGRAELIIGRDQVEVINATRRRTVAWSDVQQVEMSGWAGMHPALRLRSGLLVRISRGDPRYASVNVPGVGWRNAVADQLISAHQAYLRRNLR